MKRLLFLFLFLFLLTPAPALADALDCGVGFCVGENTAVTTVAEKLTASSTTGFGWIAMCDPDNTPDCFIGNVNQQLIQLVPGQAVVVCTSSCDISLVYGKMASSTGTIIFWGWK